MSYAIVTGLLAAVYVGVVTALGQLVRGSSFAVAVATLAVAALFQPVRRRVQKILDRRFNRTRYDAVRTVESFSSRLRDQVDLDAMLADLVSTVHATVEPSSAALWLRPTLEGSR